MTIKELSEALSLSTGTIDRVIHNRGRVNPETRKRVLEKLEEVNYKPNLNGKSLATIRHNLKIGLIMGYGEDRFNYLIYEGIKNEYARLSDCGFEIKEKIYYSFNAKKDILNYISELENWGMNALIIHFESNDEIGAEIDKLIDKGIYVITLSTDISKSKRQYFVGHNHYQSGRVGAQVLCNYMGNSGNLIVFAGRQEEEAHLKRLNGVLAYLKESNSKINLQDILFIQQKGGIANYIKVAEDIKNSIGDKRIDGILILSIYSEKVIDAIRSFDWKESVKIGAFDLTKENENFIRNHKIDFIMEQDPYSQGRKVISIIHDHFIKMTKHEESAWYTDSTIVVSENLEPYLKKFNRL